MKLSKDFRDNRFLANVYHINSKITVASNNRKTPNYPTIPNRRKIHSLKTYDVEVKENDIKTSLSQALRERKTSSLYDVRIPISFKTLSSLLVNSYGLNKEEGGFHLKTVPSAGARYPIYLYVFVFNIKDIEKGIYLWQPEINQLSMVKRGDYRAQLITGIVSVNERDVDRCSFAIVSTAILSHTLQKYGERGYRFVLLDAGHVSQNFYLVSTALKLSCKAIGGFNDDELAQMIGINKSDNAVLLIHLFGREHRSIEQQLLLNSDDYFETKYD